MDSTENFFKTACYFEASLILVAVGFGWMVDINPFDYFHFSEHAIAFGVFGTLPLFLLFLASQQSNLETLKSIRKILLETLCPSLHQHHWADLFVLAAIAGVGEELLFRGVLQSWMEHLWGMNAGLLVSSVIFGMIHALTPLYAVVAFFISVYLGLALDYGGTRNLLTPIVIHSLYDFLVFLALIKTYKQQLLEGQHHV